MVKIAKKAAFDSKVFLTTISRSRTISNYRKDEVIYSQAEPADAVFYIGRLKDEVQHRGNAFGGGTLWAKNTSS
jgi:hypothetical protein